MKRAFCLLFSVLVLLLSTSGCKKTDAEPFSDSCLTIYFFDVGQADSSLLLFPDNTVMLIDAGNTADGKEIADFIKDLNISTIDYFVCTHPHEDHIGGAKEIFNSFEVSTVCLPDIDESFDPDTEIACELNKAIETEQCRELRLSAGTLIVEKDIYNVTAVAPRKNSVYSNLNDWSLCLMVNCFTNTILFTGDAESPSEKDMLSLGINLDADILKVGHHGSANSSTEQFLNAVTPLVSVVSCGKGNTYGHPADEALTRLNNAGTKVFRTDTVGTVIAKCYDGGFNIETTDEILLDGNR